MSAPSATRVGECLGCGQHCCTSVVVELTRAMADQFLAHQPVVVPPREETDYDRWLALHAIDGTRPWVLPPATRFRVIWSARGRLPIATLPARCTALADDGSCSLYGTPERPDLCVAWPTDPRQLEMLAPAGQAACGYSFEEEND